eukprot:SAG11_NODE_9576_length_899_cov_1.335000_1_plen_50_part_00
MRLDRYQIIGKSVLCGEAVLMKSETDVEIGEGFRWILARFNLQALGMAL